MTFKFEGEEYKIKIEKVALFPQGYAAAVEDLPYLGNKVVCHSIPIRPGRNLAVICESAAVNHRQKKMGYNAAQELYQRVQNSLAKRREDEDDE